MSSADVGIFGREHVSCPLCAADDSSPWATENGYVAVKCNRCALIYVDPRPTSENIDQSVRTGAHKHENLDLDVVARRVPGKVGQYRRIVADMFRDRMASGLPVRWLDVGAGFGEVVEAVQSIAPTGSEIEGIEPMKPKAAFARLRGLRVHERYLNEISGRYDVVSAINVFSHIPDFRAFLDEIKAVLDVGGEVLIETGNASDIGERRNFPDALILPDHLVFAGESQLRRFLDEAGFEIVQQRSLRIDTLMHCAKTLIKRLIGRPVVLGLPYMSPARTLLFRARLRRA